DVASVRQRGRGHEQPHLRLHALRTPVVDGVEPGLDTVRQQAHAELRAGGATAGAFRPESHRRQRVSRLPPSVPRARNRGAPEILFARPPVAERLRRHHRLVPVHASLRLLTARRPVPPPPRLSSTSPRHASASNLGLHFIRPPDPPSEPTVFLLTGGRQSISFSSSTVACVD